jgi:hypothetical protein
LPVSSARKKSRQLSPKLKELRSRIFNISSLSYCCLRPQVFERKDRSVSVSSPNIVRALTPTIAASLVDAVSALWRIEQSAFTHKLFSRINTFKARFLAFYVCSCQFFCFKKLIFAQVHLAYAFWCLEMGGPSDYPSPPKQQKRTILHMLRELWLNGDSSLRRIYSSWEELERNLEIKNASSEKQNTKPCPNCGAKQKVALPFDGVFPFQTCSSCKNPFYVNKNLTVRRLSEEEKGELPGAWIQIVEDMNKQKVAVVFRLE